MNRVTSTVTEQWTYTNGVMNMPLFTQNFLHMYATGSNVPVPKDVRGQAHDLRQPTPTYSNVSSYRL